MNDFDTVLELRLRHLLDPVVATQPPIRRGRASRAQRPILRVETGGLRLAVGTVPMVEQVALAVPAGASRQI
jgi:hypothetical protein